ncbi:hypothetical protein NBC2815_03020 [Xanthomonas fragariae]|nr:hypothetical protein NBC2815_03020 [Xanthomonas fragariae]
MPTPLWAFGDSAAPGNRFAHGSAAPDATLEDIRAG